MFGVVIENRFREPGDFREFTCNKREIGRMIEAVEWKFGMGRCHVRGIGFDEDTIGREGGKDGSDLFLARVKEVS